MNSFPTLTNEIITNCFDKLCQLYNSDKSKLLQAAQRATVNDPVPLIFSQENVENQVTILRGKIGRTANNYGQTILIKLIEELHESLINTGALGVTNDAMLETTKLTLLDDSVLKYTSQKKWVWERDIKVEDNVRLLSLGLRSKSFPTPEIVPEYVLQYVQQALLSYRYHRTAAALSLMTIALEGTLRDALHVRGFTYTFGAPAQDVYEISDMHVHSLPDGYKVTFPNNVMPLSFTDYLSSPGSPTHKIVKIKRLIKGNRTYLEIRQANDLLDYWSSNTITQQAQVQISGLGAAINVGRNIANIISPIDLPTDLDDVIQAIRNNLIHLSGSALTSVVMTDDNNQPVSLGEFLKNKHRVFDAICTIGDAIDTIYNKISQGIL